MSRKRWLAGGLLCLAFSSPAEEAAQDEVTLKREETCEFAQKPTLTREGDQVCLAFEIKAFCDVTVAIEDANGKIVRHLASGVLGAHAPEPFQRNSKKQTLLWDGKNDQGKYIDDKDSHSVRVSLGLKPRYERNLMWCPKKRGPMSNSQLTSMPMLVTATPEGVQTFDGEALGEQLRLFDHEGNYARTISPFPAAQLKEAVGVKLLPGTEPPGSSPLRWHQDMRTLLTAECGEYGAWWPGESTDRAAEKLPGEAAEASSFGPNGAGAIVSKMSADAAGSARISALAVRGKRIALAGYRLNRLATDGSTGGLPFSGGVTSVESKNNDPETNRVRPILHTAPASAAFSPDGKWLYLTGYFEACGAYGAGGKCMNGVARMAFESDEPAKVWLGGGMRDQKSGTAHGQFRFPTAVTVDEQGRVYVCDYMNDRIEVFSPEGKYLSTLPTAKPVKLELDPRTGELWVFSWLVGNYFWLPLCEKLKAEGKPDPTVAPRLTRYAPFGDFKELASHELPLPKQGLGWWQGPRPMPRKDAAFEAVVDFWAKEPRVWLFLPRLEGGIYDSPEKGGTWLGNLRLFTAGKDGLKLARDFGKDLEQEDPQPRAPYHGRQRLYFDHRNEKLYVGEQYWPAWIHVKGFQDLVQLDPETGRGKVLPIPFSAEDMAFDMDGLAYLRTACHLARFEAQTWREVPFDYGEEAEKLAHCPGRQSERLLGTLEFRNDGNSSSQFYGMGVSPKGYVVLTGTHRSPAATRRDEKNATNAGIQKREPVIYPGRRYGSVVTVFDKHGKVLCDDALPGSDYMQGVAMDKDGFLYVQHSGIPPTADSKWPANRHHNLCTVMKVKPKTRFITKDGGILPLPKDAAPARALDFLSQGRYPTWIEKAEWIYGGVGLATMAARDSECHCMGNSRFALDYFGRSFAAELDRNRIVVLDTNGNVVLRIGRYGNVDDGQPLVQEKAPPQARSIGGDEVSLVLPLFLATHTDRRLFVADIGNYRIFSVKLGYHADEKVALKGVPDRQKK